MFNVINVFAGAYLTDRKSEEHAPQKILDRRIQGDSSKMRPDGRYYSGKGEKVNKLDDLPS